MNPVPHANTLWQQQLRTLVESRSLMPAVDFITAIAQVSRSVDEAAVDAYLDGTDWWHAHRDAITRLYYAHIVEMETVEIARLMAYPAVPGVQYVDLASERGRVSYERVRDMFSHIDFARCRRFVMVGCGQLPVTALHVMATTDVPEIVTVDISEVAVLAVERLSARFGWHRLHPQLQAGHLFDFAGADVVYLANMISPKSAALARALETAPAGAQIVMREPYGLGRLWAEKAESNIPQSLRVSGRGPVSGHLSRDLYLARTQA